MIARDVEAVRQFKIEMVTTTKTERSLNHYSHGIAIVLKRSSPQAKPSVTAFEAVAARLGRTAPMAA